MLDEITGRDAVEPNSTDFGRAKRKRRRGKGRLTGIIGLVLVVGVVLFALVGPYVIPFDPNQQDLTARLLPPMTEADGILHVLGTDALGRDLLARSAEGARTSLGVAALALIVGGFIGTTAGLIAGYFGGFRDNVIMRMVDAQLAVPNLVFAMLIASVLGPGLRNTVLALGFTAWATFARLLRAEAGSVRTRPFVEASETAGVKTMRMLRVHILPNVISTLVVVATLELGRMILAESSLSYLGLGVQPPDASWGSMIRGGQEYVYTAWWIATVPGLFIMVTVLGMNLLGDWMRDVLDPRAKSDRSE